MNPSDRPAGLDRVVRIVRGDPTDEEIAALTVALTVAVARPADQPTGPAGRVGRVGRAGRAGGWADRAYGFGRRPCPSRLHSPGCC